MANFICPYERKVCSPSCPEWEFEKQNRKGFIPIRFNPREILFSGFIMSRIPPIFALFLQKYREQYELYHPEETSTPRGHCKKLEKSFAI